MSELSDKAGSACLVVVIVVMGMSGRGIAVMGMSGRGIAVMVLSCFRLFVSFVCPFLALAPFLLRCACARTLNLSTPPSHLCQPSHDACLFLCFPGMLVLLVVLLAMFYDGCLLSDLFTAGVVAQPASGWLAHATRVASETVTDVERPRTRRMGEGRMKKEIV
jgi:hypothetical protein